MSRLLNKRYIYDVDANNLILKVEKKRTFTSQSLFPLSKSNLLRTKPTQLKICHRLYSF